MFFYELHEGDDELAIDALLAHEVEFSEDEFFGLVMDARARVIHTFEQDSLVEAVAHELERTGGFVHIEARLTAAVNVSRIDDDNFVASVEPGDDEDEDEDDEDQDDGGSDFRTLLVRLDQEQMN